MSLLAWYPLLSNGDNNGLDGTNLTTMGTVDYTAGKLGTAATFTGDSANCLHRPGFNLKDKFTWCCWIKLTGTDSGNQFIMSEGRDYQAYGFNLIINETYKSLMIWYGTDQSFPIESSAMELDTWYHIVVTVDSTDNIKAYVNGELTSSATYHEPDYTYSSNRFVIGKMSYSYTTTTNYHPFNGQICDVRIYDEVLSPKMIKEISKGLMCHYKFSNIGNKNLLSGSNFIIEATSDTAGSATDISMKYAGDLEDLIGKTVTFSYYLSAEGERLADSTTSLGNRFGIHGTLKVTYDDGTTQTIYPFTDYLTASGTHRCVMTYTFPDTTINAFRFSIQPFAKPAEGNDETWYIKYPKLEFGDTATPWLPNEADDLYSELGYDDTTLYDNSGYGLNGNIVTAGEYLSDSARYSTSYHLADLNKIKSYNIPFENIDQGTMSFWIKFNKLVNWSHYVLFASTFNWTGNGSDFIIIANGAKLSSEQTSATVNLDCCSYTGGFPASLDTWYHIVIEWDAINYVIKKYIDGVLKSTIDDSTNKRLDTYRASHSYYGFGNQFQNTTYSGDFNISDFRIYSTCLSEEDIKQLYQTPISLDNQSNLYSYEFEEV